MTAYQLDVTCKAIKRADRDQLKVIRSMLSELTISSTLYSGLNQDIRDRADWLRSRK